MPTTLPIEDREKVKKMLANLRAKNPRDALLFQTGVNTILRIGDLLRLTVGHVANPDYTIKKYIDIQEQKTGKYNRIIITKTLVPKLRAYIKRYKLTYPDDYLFYKMRNKKDVNVPITRDWASKVLVKAAKECGIPHFNTQSMRKTHALHIYEATDYDIGLVQIMCNHSSPAVTLRYIGRTQQLMDRAKEIISF